MLRHTLESLSNQKLVLSGEVEVVVVDDGSSDDTRSVCKSYNFVRYFFQDDFGFRAAKARNIGAVISRGEYIAFIDSGLVCHISFVDRMISYINKNADVFIGSIYAFNKEDLILEILESSSFQLDDNVVGLFSEQGIIDMRTSRFNLLGEDFANKKNWPVLGDISWSGNICISRRAFYEVGMFDEKFNSWGGEDIDLGIRLQEQGFEFFFAKSCYTVHIPHESQYSEEACLIKENELVKKHKDVYYMKYFKLARNANLDINTFINLHGF